MQKLGRQRLILTSKLIVLIALVYFFFTTDIGVRNFYKTQLNNGLVDSLYYNVENHSFPTVIVKDDDIKTFEIPFRMYYKDMVVVLKKGDTLIKHENSYDLYRVKNGEVDTFKHW